MNSTLFICNLCGNSFEDAENGGIVFPFGECCGDCLTAIYGENHQEKKESN